MKKKVETQFVANKVLKEKTKKKNIIKEE